MNETALTIVCSVATAFGTGVVAAITNIIQKRKSKKNYNKADSQIKLLEEAKVLIKAAEETYKDVNRILKGEGYSAGSVKKDSVMTKLQSFAIEHKLEFNYEEWSKKVDDLVEMTKVVNFGQ